jgi:catechol 2,3-dioxygenase-like lactoylglutathione lyase family enzyme
MTAGASRAEREGRSPARLGLRRLMARSNNAIGEARIVTFVVKDLAAARKFYVDRLGLAVRDEEPGRYVMVSAGSLHLCLDVEDEDQPARAGGATLIFQVRDVDGTADVLNTRGVAYQRRRGGGDYLEVRDPEGYLLVFTETL